MNRRSIEQFFKKLGENVGHPARIYLTGGIASWFWGGERPTEDIDFGLQVPGGAFPEIEKSILDLSQSLKVPVQFSEDIGRWGTVGLSDYRKGAKLHRKFGKVSVYLLDPAVWSVGKINRYYQSDVADLRKVLRSQKVGLSKLLKTWARALKESPRSSHHALFVKTARDFLKNYGKEVWGRGFQIERSLAAFEAELKRKP